MHARALTPLENIAEDVCDVERGTIPATVTKLVLTLVDSQGSASTDDVQQTFILDTELPLIFRQDLVLDLRTSDAVVDAAAECRLVCGAAQSKIPARPV